MSGQSDSKWYAPLRHPKRNHHPKFGIPTSNNIGYNLDTIILENEVRGQGHSDPKMVCDTQASQDAFTYQIWNSYFKEYRRYATVSRN